jgi:hypothetical protein
MKLFLSGMVNNGAWRVIDVECDWRAISEFSVDGRGLELALNKRLINLLVSDRIYSLISTVIRCPQTARVNPPPQL